MQVKQRVLKQWTVCFKWCHQTHNLRVLQSSSDMVLKVELRYYILDSPTFVIRPRTGQHHLVPCMPSETLSFLSPSQRAPARPHRTPGRKDGRKATQGSHRQLRFNTESRQWNSMLTCVLIRCFLNIEAK